MRNTPVGGNTRSTRPSGSPLGNSSPIPEVDTWSPTLKRYLALASVASAHSAVGTELAVEVTAEYHRHRCKARVVPKPFFDPERKKA